MARKIVYLSKIFTFETSHFLPNYNGKCRFMHGHSYKLFVTVKGPVNEETGMAMDFGDLKRIVTENIVDKYDHALLNDYFQNPTAENTIVHMFDVISSKLPHGVKLDTLRLYETETSFVEYKGEEE